MNSIEKPTTDVAETLKGLLKGKEAYFPARLYATYPQIVEKICALWRDPTVLHEYFTELLTTQREKREGFPAEIHREIFLLDNYYSALHPRARTIDDFWNGLDTF